MFSTDSACRVATIGVAVANKKGKYIGVVYLYLKEKNIYAEQKMYNVFTVYFKT